MKCRSGKRPEAFKLKPRLSGNGYYRIGLYKDGIKYERRLNRLVAMVYIPNPDNLPLVCHKDNNPLNNKVNNLYWGSVKDKWTDGLALEISHNGWQTISIGDLDLEDLKRIRKVIRKAIKEHENNKSV